MRKCIIFGANDFGSMLKFYIEKYSDIRCEAYTLDYQYITKRTRDSIPVIPFETIQTIYPPDKYIVFLAIGYRKMNDIRKEKYLQTISKGYKVENFIHPTANCEYSQIGTGNIIFENVTFAYNTQIGNGNIFWNGVQISHESVIGDFNYFAPSATLAGKTVVKNNCFVGINAAVHGARTLEDYTLVGAGAYMNTSSEKGKVYVPSRSICLQNKISKDFF